MRPAAPWAFPCPRSPRGEPKPPRMRRPTAAEAALPLQQLGAFQEANQKRNPLCSLNTAQRSKVRARKAPPAARTRHAHPAEPCHGQGELGATSQAGSAPSACWSCPAQVCADTRAESWARLPRPEQLRWVSSSLSSAMARGRLAADPAGCCSFSSSNLLHLLPACKGRIPRQNRTAPTRALGEGVGSHSCCGIARAWGGRGIRAITWAGRGLKKKKKRK